MDKQELIQKFLDNKCNEEEADLVEEYLASDPDLLNTFLLQEEWDQFDRAAANSDADLKQDIWLQVETATRKKPVHRTLYTTLAIAASILVLIIAGTYFKHSHKPASSPLNAMASAGSLQVIHNGSDKDTTFKLPDGSEVIIYPQTTIQYPADFKEDRTIRLLTGKATFDVVANPGHPFTVFSGNTSTTALGTRFLVDYTHKKVNVQLFQGKVVVKYLGKNAQIYPNMLSPGEQCFVNTNIDGITIAPVKIESIRKEVLPGKGAVAASKASMLTFSNVPLNDAFDVLSRLFNQRITYNMQEVEKMYFTGHFDVNDSLSGILHIFTSVNGLLAEIDNDVIHITKPDQKLIPGAPHRGDSIAPISAAKYTNASLEEVFSEMETTFGISIQYTKQDVANKYFTGTISSRDHVNTILTIICRMNQLELIRNNESYQIIKTRQTNK